jgi:hypothetical protein
MMLPDAAPARPASTPAMTTLSSQAAEHLAPAGDREHDVLFQAPGLGNVKMKLDGSKSRTVTVPFAAPTAPLVDTPAKTAGDGHAQPPASKSDRGEEHKHHTRHGSGGLSDDARKL